MIRLGTAAWGIPRMFAAAFGPGGSNLERYATRFGAVEVNTTFYRPHRIATFERWAASVPPDFRFAVKVPGAITHEARLRECGVAVATFLNQVAALGDRLGPLLVQLPPSLAFEAETAGSFFSALRQRFDGGVACEPRHPTWFGPAAETLLVEHRIARVAADPAPVPAAAHPGGWPGLVYCRLHGSPQMYWSAYAPAVLAETAARLTADAERVITWCVFDNTAAGAATGDALALAELIHHHARPVAGDDAIGYTAPDVPT